VIDVEKCPLRAFEQDALAGVRQILQFLGYIHCNRGDYLGRSERLFECLVKIDRLRAKIVLKKEIVVVEHFAEFCREVLTQE